MKLAVWTTLLIVIVVLSEGCASETPTSRLTLGTVQKSIQKGMSQAEVQEALGAPNIISMDSDGRAVWTYDRVSKQSASRSFLFWRSAESTQKSLTVLISFDADGKVADFTYHSIEF